MIKQLTKRIVDELHRDLTEDEDKIIVLCADIIGSLSKDNIENEKTISALRISLKNKEIIIKDLLEEIERNKDDM